MRLPHLPDGPWQGEADLLIWFHENGLQCAIVRNMEIGVLCGYVAIPPGHPRHGTEGGDLHIHGGITYADARDPRPGIADEREEDAPPGPARDWWVGFDCGHAWDIIPAMLMPPFTNFYRNLTTLGRDVYPPDGPVYRDIAYVRAEVARLAAQIAAPRPAKRARASHCRHGHEYTPGNTTIDKRGHRRCRRCLTDRRRAARAPHPPVDIDMRQARTGERDLP